MSDFSKWNAEDYLKTYFPNKVSDEEPAVKFLVEEKRKIPKNAIGIDVGCGPTVYYWASVADRLSGIHLSDFLPQNLDCIRKWVDKEPGMHDWKPYLKFILEYEGKQNISREDIDARADLARKKVLGYLHCDITNRPVLPSMPDRKFDFIMSMYCADGITPNKKNWREYMQNIVSLLNPGGFFVYSGILNCRHYGVEGIQFPSADINEQDVIQFFAESGFDMAGARIIVADEGLPKDKVAREHALAEFNYSKIVMASGFLK